MKIIKKILQIIAWVILSLIILFNVYSFASVKIFNHSLVTINGYSFLEVVSGSMEPNISVGDIIIINTKEKNYKEKDVITFKDINGSYVTHRIIEINDKGIVTKGDANDTNDKGLLAPDDIVGVYVKKINSLGLIIASLKNPITLVTILIIGIIVCVLKNTDKDGNPLDVTEEYKEFLLYREEKKKNKFNEVKKVSTEEEKTSTTQLTKVTNKANDTKKASSTKEKPSATKSTKATNNATETKKASSTKEKPSTTKSTRTTNKANENKKATPTKEKSKTTKSTKATNKANETKKVSTAEEKTSTTKASKTTNKNSRK